MLKVRQFAVHRFNNNTQSELLIVVEAQGNIAEAAVLMQVGAGAPLNVSSTATLDTEKDVARLYLTIPLNDKAATHATFAHNAARRKT